ncbi:hypothetical protein MJO48_02860 [Dickeya fangzhongdai]|uniref:hypothetical protein n=1 Tax=Dickeya fangzhongdai TaxID=1778540 RepID=UPI001EFBF5C4|nr:hypothetical protein [Dickeya fangzhongdai]ULR31671.1 hypothetical protein MJO48_02860 [Dickeya fangzhongdai]
MEDFIAILFLFWLVFLLFLSQVSTESEKPLATNELSKALGDTDQYPCVREQLSKYFSCENNCAPLSKSKMEDVLSTCKKEEENKKKEEENKKLFEIQCSEMNKNNKEEK